MGLFAIKDYKAKDELISFYGYWAPTKFNNLLQKDEGVYTFVLPEEWPEHIRDNLLFVAGVACLANKINTCAWEGVPTKKQNCRMVPSPPPPPSGLPPSLPLPTCADHHHL